MGPIWAVRVSEMYQARLTLIFDPEVLQSGFGFGLANFRKIAGEILSEI